MPYIDESVFDDQMRGLLVARGSYTSEKKKEELKRYWYLEFRTCDERAFIRVMEQLKFSGDNGFPSFRDFKDRYNIIMPAGALGVTREYCGLCREGRIFFRDIDKLNGDVYDYAANCAKCASNSKVNIAQVNPHNLHKDRLGYLRTFEALAIDRETGDLRPEYDPDYEFKVQEVPEPADGKQIAKAMFGTPDPKQEKIRDKSIERASQIAEVPY